MGLLVKEEPYQNRVAKCYRCGATIEPIPSVQWFLKMSAKGGSASGGDSLASMAERAVKSGKVRIRPKNFEKTYLSWTENVRDWSVSRQIWWGHQLPVYFCENDGEKFTVSAEKPKKCPFCKDCAMKRSEDVLDTWFSSALWPFAGMSEKDISNYYPGNALITARDILNLWVARMIFSGLEFHGRVPFTDVFINGTILSKDGRRMSKSLGTGIDPMDYIDKFGADATRFGIIWQASGQDIRWDEAAVMAGRKFSNKIWNASRFVLAQLENIELKNTELDKIPGAKTAADKKILSALVKTKKQMEKLITGFEFSPALHDIYDFFWHELCDKYIEEAKKQVSDEKLKDNTRKILAYALRESLKMLHPFMPFVTEAIYGLFPTKEGLLMTEKW
jgi:valyl-tRNA synthetase